jgi:WD40 repeat protein
MPNWNKASTLLLLTLAVTTSSAPLVVTYRTGNYSWAVAVSHDGRYVIAGSDDMHVYFFDTQSGEGKPLWSYATHGYVRHVAISGDGSSAAAGSLDGSILFFKPVISGNPAWSSRAASPIDALAMSEDGHYLAAGDRLGTIYFLKTAPTDLTRRAIPGGVLTLSMSNSGMLATTAARGGLYFFREASSEAGYTWSFEPYTSFPQLAMAGEASDIVLGGNNGYLYLVDSSGQLIDQQKVEGAVSALSISDTKERLVVGSTSGNVTLYLVRDRLERLQSLQASSPVTSTVISENGERISVADLDGLISMFNQSLTAHMWTFNAGGIVHSLSISHNGQVMAAASDTGDIYVFDEKAPQRISKTMLSTVLVAIVIVLAAGSIMWERRRKSNESKRVA